MDETKSERPIKLPKKASKVRNKAPAPVQITAEQLLREAKERDLEILPPPPKQKISDPEELKEYQLKRRKEFEDGIRKNRNTISNWIKYAKFEENQNELQRARSVFERALDIDHRSIIIWLQYAEFEIRNRQVNHARNVYDRAIMILPRASQFWLKYVYMEETLANVAGARQIFERWMEWEPGEQAWNTYINFEMRYKEVDRARSIWQRYLHVHNEARNWIRYAQFEARNGSVSNARQVFERAVEFFGDDNVDEQLLIAFAKFEEQQKEHERARVIYKFGLDRLPVDRHHELHKHYTQHEKKFGERAAIENVVVGKRRAQYEQRLATNRYDYDTWFDYLRLLENEADADRALVRDAYERAIACVPLQQDKRYWRRYIYLWYNYAIYEEVECNDYDKAREVYKCCLNDFVPHKSFTFARLWIMYAHFEIRRKDLATARKILGTAIGKCPKDKLFRAYIDLELQLREFDRCRILYEKFVEFNPENCTTWIKFAELETLLGDLDRTRAIYELAISQTALDMPEVLWKAYIDFEIEQTENDNVRYLYGRLLKRTQHVKVWMSYAAFEVLSGEENAIENARQIYQLANKTLKSSAVKEERLLLLEAWKQFEAEKGDEVSKQKVEAEMPKRVKKRRKVQTEDGADIGWEEYYDYIFPSDEASQANLKLLSMAKKWKEGAATVDQQDSGATPAEQAEKLDIPESTEQDADTDIESTSSESSSDAET